MWDSRHAQVMPEPADEVAGVTADEAGVELATVVSLDDWRRRAAVPASTPDPQLLAEARAAHPARLWADSRTAIPS